MTGRVPLKAAKNAAKTSAPKNPFEACYTVAEVKARFKELAKAAHPDVGGSHETFLALQALKDEALQEAEMNEIDGLT